MPDPFAPLYIAFSDDGEHIRRWSREPFDGAVRYEVAHVPASVWREVSNVGHGSVWDEVEPATCGGD